MTIDFVSSEIYGSLYIGAICSIPLGLCLGIPMLALCSGTGLKTSYI